jgi:putative spermidine/putrescine transport system ATP-binding protein
MALARALAAKPGVLLLDEPFGALDARVRAELRDWLRRLHEEVHVTTVFVTHDQEEAMEVADRIAVMNEGRIEQVGKPRDLYEHPATEFVAGFVGISNMLSRDGRRFTIRPEKIRLLAEGEPAGGLHAEPGSIAEVVYVGMVTRYVVALDGGGQVVVVRQNTAGASAEGLAAERGRRTVAAWDPDTTVAIEETQREEEG